MSALKLRNLKIVLLFAVVLLSIGLALWAIPVRASEPAQKTEEYCLSCHNNPDLEMTLPSGEKLSLYVSPETIAKSMHSPLGIECEACHTNISTYPHPAQTYQDKRSFSRGYYEACKKCHSTNYAKTMDSMHNKAAEAGNLNAPVCTDCHGYHNVQKPDQPRSAISTTCSQCHADIYNEYKDSVHGKALIEENNADVPVCTDCHGVHNVQDPRTAQFRVKSPELCAGCHANADLMKKYNLPADVYSLYQISWHGVDVSVYEARWPTIQHQSAVCTDCHGVHNIRSTKDPQSSVNPANLLATCQKCHPDAGPNWTGAWTGHVQISLEATPFVYYTQLFYSSFTPFVLWLSVIYVALQISRAMVDRVRRALQ